MLRAMRRSVGQSVGRVFTVVIATLLPTAAPATFAQEVTTGTITGIVLDEGGASVPDAVVTVTNNATHAERRTDTTRDGNFAMPGLQPAAYDVLIAKEGFASYRVTTLELKVNQVARLDVTLKVGGLDEAVTVTGGSVVLETETATLGQVIDEHQIRELPLNGRNITQLATLAAGVAPTPPGIGTQYGNRQQTVAIEGGRDSSTNYLVDGVGARSMRFNNLSIQLNVDAVQEFKVNRNSFSAEFGQGQSVITAVTKSGANDWHGTAYDFLRNDAFDARNFFDDAKPEYHRNQFGGTLGGRIAKDRAFFFVAYEGLRAAQGRTLLQQALDSAQVGGDFSALPEPTSIPGLGFVCIGGPCRPVDPVTSEPFPGGIVPASRISTFANVLNRVIPAIPGGGIVRPIGTFTDNFDQVTVRTDQTLSDKHTLFQRYIWYDADQYSPALFPQSNPQSAQNLALHSTYAIAPTVINEAKVGYQRSIHYVLPADPAGNPVDEIGLENLSGGANPVDFGYPVASITGLATSGDSQAAFITQGARENSYSFGDNLSMVLRDNTLKLGAEFQHRRYSTITDVIPRGLFVFQGGLEIGQPFQLPLYSGNSVANYLLGLPFVAVGAAGDSSSNYRSNFFGTFIQDDWRVNDRLTLNLGLRYEYAQPWVEENGLEGYFNTTTGLVTFSQVPSDIPASLLPLIDTTGDAARRGIIAPDRNNFAPRLGVAYRPFENTVVRAGFGVFFDNTNLNELQFTRLLPPYYFNYTLVNSIGGPAAFSTDTLFPSLDALTSFPAPFSVDPENRTPYTEQYNLSVQHQFAQNWLLEVGYSGSQSHKLWKRYDQNQQDPVTGLSPYPQFQTGMLTSQNVADANYHGGYVRLEKSYSNGFFLLTNYTYSKTIDTDSGELQTNATRDRRNFRLDRARSLFDQRHRFVTSFGYDLPFGRNRHFLSGAGDVLEKVVGGWTVNGIVGLYSGRPITVTDTAAFSTSGFAPQFPDRIATGEISNPTPERWFDTSAFVTPALIPGTTRTDIGNSGRNILDGPTYRNFDLSITKNVQLSENVRFQFRTEFFNLFNHTNFGQPISDVNDPRAGQILSALDPRQVQFGFKLIW